MPKTRGRKADILEVEATEAYARKSLTQMESQLALTHDKVFAGAIAAGVELHWIAYTGGGVTATEEPTRHRIRGTEP